MVETAISIIHYENEDLTNQCVDSIIKNTKYGTYHIVIVDNNSPTPYKRFPLLSNVSIVRNNDRHNVSGINRGMTFAMYELPFSVKYIVNFDNDIICMENWLPPLIKAMETYPFVGIVGGKQWDEDKNIYRSVGADLMGMIYNSAPIVDANILWLQGSFHMYRAEMIRQIGIHDTRFKIICSDCDYCIHANDRGWRVRFINDSNVIHLSNSSYGGKPVETEREDKKAFANKWFGMKFCALVEQFPFELLGNTQISVEYTFDEIKHKYNIASSKKGGHT